MITYLIKKVFSSGNIINATLAISKTKNPIPKICIPLHNKYKNISFNISFIIINNLHN